MNCTNTPCALVLVGLVALLGLMATAAVLGDGANLEKNLVYGTYAGGELKLDIARPDSKKGPFPAIVFIHGGGFGLYPGYGRNDYATAITMAAQKGYVAVTIDHRSIAEAEEGRTKYPFPCQLNDAKCAVRWLRANGKKFDIDSERIAVLGYSSGGYLALMVGMTTPADGLEGDGGNSQFSSIVQAVVNIAGTDDMISPNDDKPYYVAYFGGRRSDMPHNYEKANPFNYIKKGNPPILTIQGDQDEGFPLSQTFDARCKSLGAQHSLIVVKGATHDEGLLMWNDNRVWEFLRRNLGRKSILNIIGIYP